MRARRLKIVADGAQRLREAKDYSAARRRILSEVRGRHRAEVKNASFWRRLRLEVQIRRETRAELKKEFPPAALYIAAAITKVPDSLLESSRHPVSPRVGASGLPPSVAEDL